MYHSECSTITQKRAGLLPFKKRRFNLMTSASALEETARVLSSVEPREDLASPQLCHISRPKNLEALASIAASCSLISESCSSDSSNSSMSSKFSGRSMSCARGLETHNSKESECGSTDDDATPLQSKGRSKSPVVSLCESPFLSGKVVNLSVVTPTSSSKESLGRLDAPLPNGCHGRTSRNNSFCRRQPCYNGSNFCKLHYQQYLFCRARSVSMDETVVSVSSAGSTAVVHAETASKVEATSTRSDLQKTSMVQDKRYSEGKNECRCQATTTRGRPCAYVAVHETKYCYMHATYETSPPPRRGRGHSTSATSGGSTDTNLPDLAQNAKQIAVSKTKRTVDDAVPPSLSTLSLISTDHWFGKRVIVGAGPLVHQCGSIQRWGNGWVTVELENGMGVHNRRSFELIIHPKQEKSGKVDRLSSTP
eukprot:Nitzschia sp. Nitz4//scaffold110_size71422//25134//26402//NITZ4_005868-RA/size71422-processed-gene-0.5-mRNA-1//1//CDS//3329533071//9204//frame0